MLTAIVVCLGLKESNKKVSEVFPVFVPFPTVAHNLKFADKAQVEKIMANENVQNCITEVKSKLQDKGSLIVRKSGTEPVIRLKLEAKDESLIKALADEILACIEQAK